VKPNYALCRTTLYFLIIYQGNKFFSLNFGPEAIYRGYSKEKASDIKNICVIVAIIANTFLKQFITKENIYKFIVSFYFMDLLTFTGLYYSDNFD
jgi:hypothetical protein